MRLDKFLKASRLVKRRTVAQEMIQLGAVRVNDRIAKPSTGLCKGDRIEIAFPTRVISVRVEITDEVALRRGKIPYELLSERRIDRDEMPW